jgi:hypothetical protein
MSGQHASIAKPDVILTPTDAGVISMSAATRFTSDSSASDSSPTDPVIRQAIVFNAMVTNAATTDSQA